MMTKDIATIAATDVLHNPAERQVQQYLTAGMTAQLNRRHYSRRTAFPDTA